MAITQRGIFIAELESSLDRSPRETLKDVRDGLRDLHLKLKHGAEPSARDQTRLHRTLLAASCVEAAWQLIYEFEGEEKKG